VSSQKPLSDREVLGPELSGRWAILAVTAIGVTAISVLWFYTDAHTRPFLALRDAIHAEFPGSAPQVEGGRRKMHRDTPRILRITLRVSEDPRGDSSRFTEMIDRLIELADGKQGLTNYDVFDVYLVWYPPEHQAVTRHETMLVSRLLDAGRIRSHSD
jgi:hypothetical protein